MIEEFDDYFVIEECIRIQKDNLRSKPLNKTSQRRFNSIVAQNKVSNISVRIDGSMPTSGVDNWRPEIAQAIGQWNKIAGSEIHLRLVTTGEADIVISAENMFDNYLGLADPPVNGKPGPRIWINLNYHSNKTLPSSQKLQNMVHELGHCLGIRHTNWRLDETEAGSTAIPGTPDEGYNPDPNSVMNRGTADNLWVGFSKYDLVAARVMYPTQSNGDLIAKEKHTGNWYFAYSNGSNAFNTFGQWPSGWAYGTGYELFAANINGNRFKDLVAKNKYNGDWYVAYNTGTSFVDAGRLLSGWGIGTNYYLMYGDVNGDGRDDLIAKEKSSGDWYVAINNGNGFTDTGKWLTGWAIGTGYDLYTGDLSGNGFTDLFARDKYTGYWYKAISDGSKFTSKGEWAGSVGFRNTSYEYFVADVNGDSKSDLIGKDKANGDWHVALNNYWGGLDYGGKWLTGWAIGTDYDLLVEDVNGDGRQDLLAKVKWNGDWYVALSTDNSFTSSGKWLSNFAIGSGYNLLTGSIKN